MNFLIQLLLFVCSLHLQSLSVFSFQFKYDFVAGQEGKGRKVSTQPIAPNVNLSSKFDPLLVSSSNSFVSTSNDASAMDAWQKRVDRIHSAKRSSFNNLATSSSSLFSSSVLSSVNELVGMTNDLKAVESKPKEAFAPNIPSIAGQANKPTSQTFTKPVSSSIAPQNSLSSVRFTSNAQRRSQTIASNNRLKQIPSRFVSKPFASNRATSARLPSIDSSSVTNQSNAIKPKVFVANRRPTTRLQTNPKPLINSNANRNRPSARSEIKPIASQTRRFNSNRASLATSSNSKPETLNTIINTGAPFGFASTRINRNQSIVAQSSISSTRARPSSRTFASLNRQANSNSFLKSTQLATSNSKPTLAKWDQFLTFNQNQNTSYKQQPSHSLSKGTENTFAKRSGFVANFKPKANINLTGNRRSQKPRSQSEPVVTLNKKDTSQSVSFSSPSSSSSSSVRNEVIVESPTRVSREQESSCKGSKLGKRFGPDMDIWCKANCKAGHCPPIYCSCS